MSAHKVKVSWVLGVEAAEFLKRRYSRVHELAFEGGAKVKGTPAVSVVPAPWSAADGVDPEAAFTGALSACHMLWFLDHVARAGFVVGAYLDEAEGTLGRIGPGRMAMTRVVLRPEVTFAGELRPTAEQLAQFHEAAHRDCFIANSVTTEVVVEPR